jgi:hypothetical protein
LPISGKGWELHALRLGVQRSNFGTRTYGSYQAFFNGGPIENLSGNVCECPGPGENSKRDVRLIKAVIHFGRGLDQNITPSGTPLT